MQDERFLGLDTLGVRRVSMQLYNSLTGVDEREAIVRTGRYYVELLLVGWLANYS